MSLCEHPMTPEIFGAANSLLVSKVETTHPALAPMPEIPAFRGNGLCVTVWRPTMEEAALLMGGGVLVLTVQGESHPLSANRSPVSPAHWSAPTSQHSPSLYHPRTPRRHQAAPHASSQHFVWDPRDPHRGPSPQGMADTEHHASAPTASTEHQLLDTPHWSDIGWGCVHACSSGPGTGTTSPRSFAHR